MDYAQTTSAGIAVPSAPPSLSSAISRLDQVIAYLSGHSEQSGAYADVLGGGSANAQGIPLRGTDSGKGDSTVAILHARIDRLLDLTDITASNLSRIGNAIGSR